LKRIYLGLVALAALMVLPLSGALVNSWNETHHVQTAMVPLLKFASALLVGAVAAHILVLVSGLKARLATPPPGTNVMLAGAMMFALVPACLALLMVVGVRFLAFIPVYGLTHYPALIVLIVGACRVLRHLKPRVASQDDGAQG
jgi:hypothetical protein